MKRILTLILSLVLAAVCIFPVQVHAASASSSAGIVSTAQSGLNVRSAASSGASVVTTIGKGSYVTLESKTGNWWRVEYADGAYGYCHADYIMPVQSSPATVQITSGTLNVRSGAGTAYSRTGSLSKGERVLVLSSSGGWSRILYDGTKTGYVSAQYLSKAQTYPNVSLSVPNYKQTDSRWANVTLGSSGKTMRQSGCTTTALAMIESYRTGRTVYPDAMAKTLRYSASGDLYWPSDYIVVTNADLSGIYRKLQQGKPVLYGVKNNSGRQHWVVITGYNGGDVLTASGFTIHDPGSAYRTNLRQLLDVYPNFYKYFYY